jgi:hypothetical protein
MVCRAGGFGRAVLRLARFGFYDEALSLVRSLGEIANLLMLFHLDSAAMIDWKNSDFSARNRRFRPAQIRNRVLQRSGHLPMSQATYQRLCEVSTHPVPDLKPQLFNPHGSLMCGGIFQPAGFLVALNETAELESWIVLLGSKLCQVPEDCRQRIKQDCIECVKATGRLKVLSLPLMWEELGKKGP